MKPPCPDCHRIHTTADTYALRRFEPTLAHTYAAAERDMCRHRQENR